MSWMKKIATVPEKVEEGHTALLCILAERWQMLSNIVSGPPFCILLQKNSILGNDPVVFENLI